MKQLSIVVPVYNEQEMIPLFFKRMEGLLRERFTYEYVFVNDGSKDNSLAILKELAAQHSCVKIVSLSRNFGKEAAVTAGLSYTQAQAVVIMDVDLQDPPELIPTFWEKFEQGYENIYGQRVDRSSDSFFKRITAQSFYKLYNKMASWPIPYNTGDFRMMSRRAVQAVCSLPEKERFMKGLFSWVGYKSIAVPYRRESRAAGQTKWNYWKLWNFALGGITSATSIPLKLWTYFGLLVSFGAFIFAAWIAYKKWVWGNPVSGYASLMVTILFFSGVQLITLGVIGEYLSRIFVEVKQRPAYLVDETINLSE
ncbi:MAG: glycosyltransferase family 2 protein [Elusimicrobiaceae bacterium]|nr:glycosyltransferase family 2 protein [Elusimicrobiaceae bacterium]